MTEAPDVKQKPLTVGIIADIQYADADDGSDFSGLEKRYFRNSIKILEAAVNCWNDIGVDSIITLGDAIDGRCRTHEGNTEVCLRRVLDVLERSRAPNARIDMIGNHELYNFPREELRRCGLSLTEPGVADGPFYWCRQLNEDWEAIFLDGYEHSLIGYPDGHPCLQAANNLIMANNPAVVDGKGGDWFDGLPVEKHRYVPYNGAISSTQLQWLNSRLAAAKASGRNVVVFSHIPVYQPATKPKTILWNSEEVLSVLHEHSETVVAVLAGHDHDGGYAVDDAGVHHITMNSPLTATPGEHCFGVLEFHKGWAKLIAHGRAVCESNRKGGTFPELILKKDAVNTAV